MTVIDSTWATTGELRGQTIALREGSRIVEEAKEKAGRILAAADQARDAAGDLLRAAEVDKASATAALADAERRAADILAGASRQAEAILADAQLIRAMAEIDAQPNPERSPEPPVPTTPVIPRVRRGIGRLIPDASGD